MATQLPTSSFFPDRPDETCPSKVERIATALTEPRKLSEGQHIPLHREFINQTYICKREICL